jgi:hypothetical protein
VNDASEWAPGAPCQAGGDPRFHALLAELGALHDRKSADYATSVDPLANFRECASFGLRPYHGLLCRIADKWRRVQSFSHTGALRNESIRDAHMDSAAYHLIAILLLEDEKAPDVD